MLLVLSLQCALALSVPKFVHRGGGGGGVAAPVAGAAFRGRGAAVARPAADAAADEAGSGAVAVDRGGALKSFLVRRRTPLLFSALVAQKVLADVLTDYTRRRGAYSGATVSMLSEVAKFPVLVGAICVFGGGARRLGPTARRAVEDTPRVARRPRDGFETNPPARPLLGSRSRGSRARTRRRTFSISRRSAGSARRATRS